jgi:hypothetical protein
MTFVLFGADSARVMSLSGHCKTGHFSLFLPITRFPAQIWRQDRLGSTIANLVDLEHLLFFAFWATTAA